MGGGAVLADYAGIRCEVWFSREELAEQAYHGPEAHGAMLTRRRLRAARAEVPPRPDRRGAAAAGSGFTPVRRCSTGGAAGRGRATRLVTPRGSISARRVMVATNGYTSDRLHPALAGTFLPAFSNIVVPGR